jgi:hypothetical protein
MFKRRVTRLYDEELSSIGPSNSSGMKGCPDIWEMENGDFAVIGIRSTSTLMPHLPKEAGCGPDEEIVILPRAVFLSSK